MNKGKKNAGASKRKGKGKKISCLKKEKRETAKSLLRGFYSTRVWTPGSAKRIRRRPRWARSGTPRPWPAEWVRRSAGCSWRAARSCKSTWHASHYRFWRRLWRRTPEPSSAPSRRRCHSGPWWSKASASAGHPTSTRSHWHRPTPAHAWASTPPATTRRRHRHAATTATSRRHWHAPSTSAAAPSTHATRWRHWSCHGWPLARHATRWWNIRPSHTVRVDCVGSHGFEVRSTRHGIAPVSTSRVSAGERIFTLFPVEARVGCPACEVEHIPFGCAACNILKSSPAPSTWSTWRHAVARTWPSPANLRLTWDRRSWFPSHRRQLWWRQASASWTQGCPHSCTPSSLERRKRRQPNFWFSAKHRRASLRCFETCGDARKLHAWGRTWCKWVRDLWCGGWRSACAARKVQERIRVASHRNHAWRPVPHLGRVHGDRLAVRAVAIPSHFLLQERLHSSFILGTLGLLHRRVVNDACNDWD